MPVTGTSAKKSLLNINSISKLIHFLQPLYLNRQQIVDDTCYTCSSSHYVTTILIYIFTTAADLTCKLHRIRILFLTHNFFEAKKVPSRYQIEWARVCAIVFRELSEVANEIDCHRERLADFNLKLERRIKMFFILPTLLLRKTKGDGKLLSDLKTRFRHWKLNQWKELIEDLEADIVRVHGRTSDSTPPNSKSA